MSNVKTNHRSLVLNTGLAGLTQEQLDVAHSEAEKQKISLCESILKLGVVSEEDFLRAAAEETGLEFLNIYADDIENEALKAVTANIATHYNIVPLKIVGEVLYVATCDPLQLELKNELELILDNSHKVEFILSTSEATRKAIRQSYGVGAATVEQMVDAESIVDGITDKKDLMDENKARDASVIKLVNQLLVDAISLGATDIHIEPYENDIKARYRIDGMLQDSGIPKTVRFFREGITSRIKIMSGLDIAEKRLPQDGGAQVNIAGQRFDLRVSILPTKYGEGINIRILPQTKLITDLHSLGMADAEVEKFSKIIIKPHGIVLVTGPTGSGKTTTLYACMNMLKKSDKKIITIEDPIEYDMPGLIQMQVHTEIGFIFARALRSMLRHDPDIMLVGEIRDLETAETAIRTALTGHLVFSTLHTNDAASAITRLLDMGIEPYLIASSIEAILAQRLVRVICSNCKQTREAEPEILMAIKSLTGTTELPRIYHGTGCSKCRFTGYRGRTVITELLLLSESIREMILSRRHSNEIDEKAHSEGMTSLFLSGMDKVNRGITTYEEVLRVTKGAVPID
jgi:type II secretory ATPase GspE/PulE/Tfp pilus assembly ATPase PilB-like protein